MRVGNRSTPDFRNWDKPHIVLLRSAHRLLVGAEERFCMRLCENAAV